MHHPHVTHCSYLVLYALHEGGRGKITASQVQVQRNSGKQEGDRSQHDYICRHRTRQRVCQDLQHEWLWLVAEAGEHVRVALSVIACQLSSCEGCGGSGSVARDDNRLLSLLCSQRRRGEPNKWEGGDNECVREQDKECKRVRVRETTSERENGVREDRVRHTTRVRVD